MAEVKYKICDRCGEKMNYNTGWTSKIFGIKKVIRLKVVKYFCGNQDGYSYSDYQIELCKKCTEELFDFLEGGIK